MTLYLKYRPQTLEELDPENVRESLTKIVSSGKIPHAFLFSGPKGTGKTSAARILAKIVNCEKISLGATDYRLPQRIKKDSSQLAVDRKLNIEPCNKCYQCTSITRGENLDVVELDAASHRGIDEARAIRDAVKLAPGQARVKVYIIDEAHMLTTEASNALLKTLEEPPSHVMFILATTNPEKLVETIRSRTTNIVFKRATPPELVRSLTKIVKGEKLKVEAGVIETVARASDGSFRDAAKILEQLVSEGKSLDVKTVEEFLFQRKAFSVEKFLELLAKKDTKAALTEIEKGVESGVSVRNMTDATLERLRNALLAKVGMEGEDLGEFSKEDVILLIKLLSRAIREIPDAVLEQLPLEIAVVEWCQAEPDRALHDERGEKPNEKMETERITKRTGGVEDKNKSVTSVTSETEEVIEIERVSVQKGNGIPDEIWSKILGNIRPRNTSTEALLRAAKPVDYDGKTLTLGVYYRFHKERLEGYPHRMLLEEAVAAIIGNPVRVVCTLTEPPAKNVLKEGSPPADRGSASASSDGVLTEGEDEDIIKVAKEIFGS